MTNTTLPKKVASTNDARSKAVRSIIHQNSRCVWCNQQVGMRHGTTCHRRKEEGEFVLNRHLTS